MTDFLVRTFIRDHEQVTNNKVRELYGRLGSTVGILVNLLLFAGKFITGTIFGSVSITADGVNNLSDAGSSVISLLSFRLASRPADREHPFGHARIEYISSLVVALLILMLGFELGKSSVEKILHPEMVEFNLLMAVVLVCSILLKLWLYLFNRNLGRRIDSSMMAATAADSLSDVMATSAVLLSVILSPIIGYPLDGWMGLVVAVFILRSGYGIIREALDKLLGDAPTQQLVEDIESFVSNHEGVLGVHDLMVHSYGPNRCFASVHAEVSANEDILKSHDMIDNIEREILEEMGVHLVIHLDPVVTDDPEVNRLRQQVAELVQQIDPSLTIHDFRLVRGETHSNLIFDVTVPFDCTVTNPQLLEQIEKGIKALSPHYYAVVTMDRSYTSSVAGTAKMD